MLRSNATKYEVDIESERLRHNYSRCVEIVLTIGTKVSHSKQLKTLLQCASIYHDSTKDLSHADDIDSQTRERLRDCDAAIVDMLREQHGNQSLAKEWRLDANCLRAKIAFLIGDIERSRNILETIDLTALHESFAGVVMSNATSIGGGGVSELSATSPRSFAFLPHHLRAIVTLAEMYMLRGKCAQSALREAASEDPATSTNTSRMLENMSRACKLTYSFYQEMDHIKNAASVTVGVILESFLRELPAVITANLPVADAARSLRLFLCLKDTKSMYNIKLLFAKELVELLLFQCCPAVYPSMRSAQHPPKLTHQEVAELPVRYNTSGGDAAANYDDEVALLLHICIALANRKVSNKYDPTCKSAEGAVYVYSLLIVYLQRRDAQWATCRKLEEALRFGYENHQLWKQYALALTTAGHFTRAYRAFEEAMRMRPESDSAAFMARLSFCHLHNYETGVGHAERALELVSGGTGGGRQATRSTGGGEKSNRVARSRLHVLIGIGQSLSAEIRPIQVRQNSLYAEAFCHFKEALDVDNSNHVALYQMARVYAIIRQPDEARTCVTSALRLRRYHAPSLYLLALLDTASGRLEEAIEITNCALDEHPSFWPLWFLLVRLERLIASDKHALDTCKKRFLPTAKEHLSSSGAALAAVDCLTLHGIGGDVHGGDTALGGVAGRRGREAQTMPNGLSRPNRCLSAPGGSRAGGVAQSVTDNVSERSWATTSHNVDPAAVTRLFGGDATSLLHVDHLDGDTDVTTRNGGGDGDLLFHVWLLLAELYTQAGDFDDAESCIAAAAALAPLSHHLHVASGEKVLAEGRIDAAAAAFQTTAIVQPRCARALLGLARAHFHRRDLALAHKFTSDAIAIDAANHQSWLLLGKVLLSDRKPTAAAKCLQTAVDLRATSPLLPYASAPCLVFD